MTVVRYLRLAGLLCVAVPGLALAQAPAAKGAPRPAGAPRAQDDEKGRSLEERVTDLKEKIFRTKVRLMNLEQMVVGGSGDSGGSGTSRAVLVHRNEMGSSFYLESVSYSLDGQPVFSKADANGDLDERPELEVFSGRVTPGSHRVSVLLVYRGHGEGVFGYLDGYRFKVQSAHTFDAEPGKVSHVKVVGFEKDAFAGELKDRPAVRYDVDTAGEEPARGRSTPAAAEGKRR